MRTRHRVPTLFTLSMLDVFCCALGCASLLWLWNERLAAEKAGEADRKMAELQSSLDELDRANKRIDSLERDLSTARGEIAALTSDRDRTRADLAAARKEVADRMTDLNAARGDVARLTKDKADLESQRLELSKQYAGAADMLSKKIKEIEQQNVVIGEKAKDEEKLKAMVAAAQKRVLDLETLTRQKEEQLTTAMRRVADLDKQLDDVDGRLKQVRRTADQVPELQSKLDLTSRKLAAAESRLKDMEPQGERLSAAENRVREVERDLVNRKAAMAELQGQVENLKRDKDSLSGQVTRMREAADNRFAGIQLTGRRVLFLVDMSGSMKLAEDGVPAPDKWPAVIDTLARVMKSLPDLEKFQVIAFSEDVYYPLGNSNGWLDYDANTSVSRVRQVLANTVPKGNTNMFAAFDAAFRLRAQSMDTIYLLSDGLPNIGQGLTPEQARNLKETERSELLGRYIRTLLKQRWNQVEPGLPRVRINSIGFFYESPDVGAFLWALSREHDGSFVGMSRP